MEKNYIAEKKGRVNVLDVLRVVAVIMVILSHYYLNYPDVGRKVAWGALGVQLFFIISGFVIYASLENTKNYRDFIVKRFLRLSPAMFICSTIIFVFFRFFYTGEGYTNSKLLSNYLIANTFIDPTFINVFFGRVRYYYLDGAFWSLWVEIGFYTLIGLLYFINKNNELKTKIFYKSSKDTKGYGYIDKINQEKREGYYYTTYFPGELIIITPNKKMQLRYPTYDKNIDEFYDYLLDLFKDEIPPKILQLKKEQLENDYRYMMEPDYIEK